MRTLTILTVCVLGIGLANAASRHDQADVVLKGGNAIEGYIIKDGFDTLEWSQDRSGKPVARQSQAQINNIIYKVPPGEVDFFKGKGKIAESNWPQAVSDFKAASQSRYPYIRFQSALYLAEANARMQKVDEAVAALDVALKEFADWRWALEIQNKKGEVLLKAGKADDAAKVYNALKKAASGYGAMKAEATTVATVGLARILLKKEDFAGAEKSLSAALKSLDPVNDGELFAAVGLELAEAQKKLQKMDAAIETCQNLRFRPIPGAQRATAHRIIAEVHKEAGRDIEAFDSAVMALVTSGIQPIDENAARKVARSLAKKLATDESLGPVQQKEYRDYLSSL